MKMRKLKRIFSMALASAMALSLVTVPVSAEETSNAKSPKTSISFTKTVHVTTNGTPLPTMDFAFTMAPAQESDLVVTTTNETTGEVTTTPLKDPNGLQIQSGPAMKTETDDEGFVTDYGTVELSFDDTDNTSSGDVTKTGEFQFKFASDFPNNGVYRYFITENIPSELTPDKDGKYSNGYVTYDKTKYILDLYVTEDTSTGTHYVYNYTLRQDGATAKPENITFKNEVKCSSLNIYKKVEGEEFKSGELYTFRILIPVGGTTITLEEGHEFKAKIMDGNGWVKDTTRTNADGYVIITVKGESMEKAEAADWTQFQLKKGEWLEIEGAPVTMVYKVEEVVDDASVNASGKSLINEGYTTTYSYKETGVKLDSATIGERTDVSGHVVQGTINTDTNQVTFTNNRKITVDTGINLDFAPYVLIVLIAVCGGILFIARKRRVDR
jgi:hypothetical protein